MSRNSLLQALTVVALFIMGLGRLVSGHLDPAALLAG
jgi:hypothetical protein